MALKAYKHLTDGEVKLVEADSAEETSILADVVHGASYLQLTSSGHSQEVAAAQGDSLWEDVTDELGGGGSAFAHLSEDTPNSQIEVSWPFAFSNGVDAPDVWLVHNVASVQVQAVGADPDTDPKCQIGNDGSLSVLGAGGVTYVYLDPSNGSVYLQNATGNKTLVVDADGDLSIQGVGKIAIQP